MARTQETLPHLPPRRLCGRLTPRLPATLLRPYARTTVQYRTSLSLYLQITLDVRPVLTTTCTGYGWHCLPQLQLSARMHR